MKSSTPDQFLKLHPNTATLIEYIKRMGWKTPFPRRLRSINMQWKIAIDSLGIKCFDFSSYCQGDIQPRNSHRLGLIQNGRLVCHNRHAYGRQREEARWEPEQYIPDRGIGPSGAQMLSNLQLTQPALLMQSPLRDSLVHLNISGCQSINKSSIDILLRLSNLHLPKLQRIDMAGLRLEL